MSTIGNLRRRLFVGSNPYLRTDPRWPEWRKNAQAQLSAKFKADEYMKHKPHQKALERAINEEIALREWQRATGGM